MHKVLKILKKLDSIFETTIKFLVTVCFVSILLAATIQVFTRFVIGSAWFGAEELCRYLLIWLAFVSGGLAMKKHAHIGVEVIVDLCPVKIQWVIKQLQLILIMLFSAVLCYVGMDLTVISLAQRTNVLGIPTSLVYVSVPLSGFLMFFYGLCELVENFVLRKDRAQAEKE